MIIWVMDFRDFPNLIGTFHFDEYSGTLWLGDISTPKVVPEDLYNRSHSSTAWTHATMAIRSITADTLRNERVVTCFRGYFFDIGLVPFHPFIFTPFIYYSINLYPV